MQAWLKEHDITFDESLIKINTDPYSITSLQPLAVGTVICQIPKTAILSCKTTAIADILEQEQLAGILGLAVALMFEWSLGERSPWSTYIESLPSLDTVPLFWTPEQLEHLAGTDLGNALPSERDYFIVDFAELVVPLVAKHGLNKEFMTCERFMQATFWATSRAFEVDDYHGDSMVPLADMFNHKTRGEHVHFTSEGQVCEYCGEIDGCGCGSENDEGDDADEPNPNGEDAPEEIIDTSDADNDGHMPGPQMLEMVIVNACPANAEVFNTYGELSNASLLNRYGFIEENNPFSLVEVTREDIFKQIDKPLLESEETSDRIGFWDQVGRNIVEKIEDDISLDGDDEEDCGEDDDETCCVEGTCDHEDDPEEQSDMFDEDGSQDEEEETDDNFQIEATGCPNFHLRAFLTLIHMPHSEFEAICHDLEKVIQALTHISNSPWNPKTKKGKAKSGLQSLIANSVLKIASSRLSEYPSRVEDDFEKLKTVKDERSRHAINLCIEEKTILAKCIEISS